MKLLINFIVILAHGMKVVRFSADFTAISGVKTGWQLFFAPFYVVDMGFGADQ